MSIGASIITTLIAQVGLLVSLSSSPATLPAVESPALAHTFSTSPASCHADLLGHAGDPVDSVQRQRWCDDARHELETALRVVRVVNDDSGPEVICYLEHLEQTLSSHLRESLDTRALPTLTRALRDARETLLEHASTLSRWTSIARAIQHDPNGWLPVPERFVSWMEPAPEGRLSLAADQQLILRGGLLVLDAPLSADDLDALQADPLREAPAEDPPHGAS